MKTKAQLAEELTAKDELINSLKAELFGMRESLASVTEENTGLKQRLESVGEKLTEVDAPLCLPFKGGRFGGTLNHCGRLANRLSAGEVITFADQSEVATTLRTMFRMAEAAAKRDGRVCRIHKPGGKLLVDFQWLNGQRHGSRAEEQLNIRAFPVGNGQFRVRCHDWRERTALAHKVVVVAESELPLAEPVNPQPEADLYIP